MGDPIRPELQKIDRTRADPSLMERVVAILRGVRSFMGYEQFVPQVPTNCAYYYAVKKHQISLKKRKLKNNF